MNEEQAAAALRNAIQKLKLDCYEYQRILAKADRAMLDACGARGKSNAEAVLAQVVSTEATIERLIRAHEKRFPMKPD